MLRKHVVIVGGGFGGLACTKALRGAAVRITLVDRSNHHLFQPLLYQVAMAGLAPAEIATPIRSILRAQANARVLLDEVKQIDVKERQIHMQESDRLSYDYLVLATGSCTNYFGHKDWSTFAPGLKSIDDAVEIRRRVLLAFECAERESDENLRRELLTFVVIGGGATGVELAGAVAELAGFVLSRDFRVIHPDLTQVILIEGGARVLPHLEAQLSEKAATALQDMGVELRMNARVTSIDANGVMIGEERIRTRTVLWAAGVQAAALGATLGAEVDRSGRVIVKQDCSIAGYPEVFCIGDAACFIPEGKQQPLPGVSPTAMQQGRFVARQIIRSLAQAPRERFEYTDKGSMATIGRSRAVMQSSNGKLQLSGFLAWLAWLLVHIFYLIDFRNRVIVLFNWAWSYITYRRGSRLITGGRLDPGAPLS